MPKEIAKKLREICYDGVPWHLKERILAYADELEIGVHQPKQRTEAQNKSLHLLFEHIAKHLNDSHLGVQLVLAKKAEIEWDAKKVKYFLWHPFQFAVLAKKSTTELSKIEDIDAVYDHLVRYFAQQHQIEMPPFPNDPSILKDTQF